MRRRDAGFTPRNAVAARHRGGRGRSSGFTLIEIMVVVVIIGILAALVITQFAGKDDKAAQQATKAIISQVETALDLFKMDHKKYPDRLEDLQTKPGWVDSKNWPRGGYLKKKALDGWAREFIYRVPGSGDHPYDVISLGADGKEGGTQMDEDIWNHDRDQ